MIRKYQDNDLLLCSYILMTVYNNELWECHWTAQTAQKYLQEIVDQKRFVGFTLWENEKLIGAIFTHEKTWWSNDEIFIDEMFVLPEYQRKGHGTELIQAVEKHILKKNLAGLTLTTYRTSFAPEFYKKNGFHDADHVLYMSKVIRKEDKKTMLA